MVQVYVGDGKGKTTAAFGQALRALGSGWRVVAVQFLKDGTSGEARVLAGLPGVAGVLHDGARAKFSFQMDDGERACSRALHDANLRRALELADGAGVPAGAESAGGAPRPVPPGCLLVLDEALDALRAGLLDEGLLRAALAWGAGAAGEGPARELVVTGHSLPPFVRAAADYLTEMRCEEHPYRRGVGARPGVEY